MHKLMECSQSSWRHMAPLGSKELSRKNRIQTWGVWITDGEPNNWSIGTRSHKTHTHKYTFLWCGQKDGGDSWAFWPRSPCRKTGELCDSCFIQALTWVALPKESSRLAVARLHAQIILPAPAISTFSRFFHTNKGKIPIQLPPSVKSVPHIKHYLTQVIIIFLFLLLAHISRISYVC